jgi:hypothetical protein
MSRVQNWLLVLTSGFITLLVFSVVLISCKKDLGLTVFSVSGIVYNDCSNTPFANKSIQLVHYTNSAIECKSADPITITDETGRFSFGYSDNCNSFSYSDEYQIVVVDNGSPGPILVNRVPGKGNVDVGAIYVSRKSKLVVKVNISSALPGDTLYFGVDASEFKSIYPVANSESLYEFSAATQLYQNKNTTNTLFFAIGMNAYKAATLTPASSNSVVFQDFACSSKADSVNLQLP